MPLRKRNPLPGITICLTCGVSVIYAVLISVSDCGVSFSETVYCSAQYAWLMIYLLLQCVTGHANMVCAVSLEATVSTKAQNSMGSQGHGGSL